MIESQTSIRQSVVLPVVIRLSLVAPKYVLIKNGFGSALNIFWQKKKIFSRFDQRKFSGKYRKTFFDRSLSFLISARELELSSKSDLSRTTKCDQNSYIWHLWLWSHLKLELSMSFGSTNRA